MRPTPARAAWLALVAVTLVAAPGRAQGAPAEPSVAAAAVEQDEDAELNLARDELRAERARVEDEVGALQAAHDSVKRTLEWLQGRTDWLVAESDETAGFDAAALAERLTDLRRRRRDLAADLGTLGNELKGFDAASGALLITRVRVAELLDMVEAAGLMRGRVDSVGVRADKLVRDTVSLNVDAERARLILDGARQPATVATPVDVPPAWLADEPVVELVTSEGSLVLELRPDVAPRHVENFQRLVREGFYDGLGFHRVLTGFVAQGGDPLGTGMGGPGWQIRNEFNGLPHHRGTLSMARMAQWDTAGSQFFLCLDDWSAELDGKYTVFGRLLAGESVLAAIEALGTDSGTPRRPITIQRAVLRERLPDELPGEQG